MALLAGALVVARSPATVIAIVKEVAGDATATNSQGVTASASARGVRARARSGGSAARSLVPSSSTTVAVSSTPSPFAKIIVGVTVRGECRALCSICGVVCSGVLSQSFFVAAMGFRTNR